MAVIEVPGYFPGLRRGHRPSFVFSCALLLLTPFFAAQAATTVRHHYTEKSESPLVDEAESDFTKDDFASAETKLTQAVKADPEDYRAWYDLGFAEHALGKNAAAISAYKKAVELKPDLFEAQLNLGLMLAASGDAAAAESALKHATTLKPQNDPENGLARAWLGLAQLQQKDHHPEAIASG